MKKLFIFIFAMGMFGAAQAQFGARAGFSSANITDFSSDAVAGLHLGAYYKKEFGFIDVEPGIQFSQKGYKNVAVGMTGVSLTQDERLNYIDVPVLVRFNFLPFLNVFAGPQGSILVSRKLELSNGASETTTEPVKGFDIAGVIGLNAKLPWNLNAQMSYDIGFQSLNYYDQDVKNRALKISIGYDF